MKRDLWQSIPRRRRKWALWIGGILLSYAILGAVLLPPIVRHIAVKQLSRQLGRDVTINAIHIHPFDCSVTIRDLLIKEPDGTPFVSWETVHVNFQLLSVFGKAYTVRQISTTKPSVHVRVNADGTFNFSDILGRFATNTPTTTAPKPSIPSKSLAVRIQHIRVDGFDLSLENHLVMTNAPAAQAPAVLEAVTNAVDPTITLLRSVADAFTQLIGSTNQIRATIDDVLVTNGVIHFEDVTPSRPAKLDLSEITLVAKGLSNDAGAHPMTDLSLRWNQNGSIHVATTASYAPAMADIQVDLDRLDFRSLDSYLEPKLDLFVLGSRLGVHGAVRLRTPADALPEVTFQGDVRLDGLRTVDGVMGEDLLKWGSLQISGIAVALHPQSVAIKQIRMEDLFARLVIETNKTINLLNALRLTRSDAPTNATEVAAVQPASTPAMPLPKISIDAIVITNAQIRFSDYSLSPNVNMQIQQAGGTISGISSEALQHADLDLEAAVDGVGPVAITGTINPFNPAFTNRIRIAVQEVDLTPTGPYSAKFAGYRIAKGKLYLDLEYEIVGKHVTAKNVITVDQFTFGEQVDSPDATHLPVRLAVAILKDRNGKIILDVPVEGSLDDPKFRISKVVWRTLGNIITKAALSPFSLLGAMFGGGEELDHQPFAAGDAALSAENTNKLEALAKALYERPALEMEITGSVDPDGDRQGLQRMAIDRQIRSRIWAGLRRSSEATNAADQVVVSPEDRQRWVKKLYGEALADRKITPQLVAQDTNLAIYAASVLPKSKGTKGATQLIRATGNKSSATNSVYRTPLVPAPDPMEALLMATIPVEKNDLEALAAARARAVQAYLLQTGKVEAGRLFLKESSAEGLRNDGSRVYLQFK